MRRFPAANREAPGVGPASLGQGGGGGLNGQGLLKVTFLCHHKRRQSRGEERRAVSQRKNETDWDANTLLDLLFKFMHKSNNTKRKTKQNKIILGRNHRNSGKQQPHSNGLPRLHPSASSTSTTRKQRPQMVLEPSGTITQDKEIKKTCFSKALLQVVFLF